MKNDLLAEMRCDLKPIIDMKKLIEINHLYNKNKSPFFDHPKDIAISELSIEIKLHIIELSEKYKKQFKNGELNGKRNGRRKKLQNGHRL